MAKATAILQPNLGIYTNRGAIAIPDRALVDGLNFRCRGGVYTNKNLGWERVGDFTLNGPVTLVGSFRSSTLVNQVIYGTPKDLYVFDAGDDSVAFITPIYNTGTASASGTSVTGVGTSWLTNAKAGDEISFGSNSENDPDATWFEVAAVGGDLSITLTTSAGTVVDGPYTLRQTFEGSDEDYWDEDMFINAAPENEDQWFATNGVDVPVRWNGNDAQVERLTGLGFTCKTLRTFRNMMLYGNLIQGGDTLVSTIRNSDIGTPANVSTGFAEQFVVHSGTEPITSLRTLGDALVIYTGNRGILTQFVGDPIVFAFRQAFEFRGPVSPRAAVSIGYQHFFISGDAFYAFDGIAAVEDSEHFWRLKLDNADPAERAHVFGFHDNTFSEILWMVPQIGDLGATKAFGQHHNELPRNFPVPTPFSIRSFPFTAVGKGSEDDGDRWNDVPDTRWSDEVVPWNFGAAESELIFAGNAAGEIYKLNVGQSADGAALPSFVRYGRRPTGMGQTRGLITRVYPFIREGVGNMIVRLKLYDTTSGPLVSQNDDTIVLDGTNLFVSPFRRARFYELEFRTEELNAVWEMDGYDIQLRMGGHQ